MGRERTMELKLLLLVGTALLATSVIGIAPDAQSEVQVLMEVDEVSSVGKITDEEVAALKNRLDAAISHTTASEKNLATNKLSAVQYAKEMEAAANEQGKNLASQKLDKATEQEQKFPGCNDQYDYKALCPMKVALCEDKDFGKEIVRQCARSCGKIADHCP